jgi:pilus assembly protein CpaD
VLSDAPRTLDVFVNGAAGLDPRQRQDVHAFGLEYRRYGRGALIAQLPTGTGHEASAQRTVEAIRDALAEAGVPGGYLSVSTYPIANPAAASAIRLSFQRLQAKVASKCGLWPQDLGVGDYAANVRNDPYWNQGCALQTTVAAQVVDPLDLVRPRQEGRIDTARRSKVIESLREGRDPSTEWRQEGQTSSKQQVTR